jgi:uncharacterized repeat protein (TIGR03987 family)
VILSQIHYIYNILVSAMSTLLILSTTLISLALVFYSIGIWAERFSKYLKGWHVAAFWTGFIFDVSGTLSMAQLSQDPYNLLALHSLTGQIALWLMLIHATWATYAVRKGSDKVRTHFHRYSLMVWFIWLIPYLGGMIMGMRH